MNSVNSTAESFRWRIFQSGGPIVNKNSQFQGPIPLNLPRWISEIENIGLVPSQICTSFLSRPFSLPPWLPPRSPSAKQSHTPQSERFHQRPQLDRQNRSHATPVTDNPPQAITGHHGRHPGPVTFRYPPSRRGTSQTSGQPR